jgi:quercetin dioxygenase-like cupin family protein
MTKRAAAITLLVAIAMPPAAGAAEALSPTRMFEGNTTAPARNGTAQPIHVSVQSWGIGGERGQDGPPQDIPLRGFYVAHLLSGHISATMDGQTAEHLPGDYWTVNAGATMQVKVRGEFAMLETTVVSRQ